jgi:uncharacterized LabA/DUF88 family protein
LGAAGPWFTTEAAKLLIAGGASVSYEGIHVYLSYNPKSDKDKGLKNWASNTLDKFPGVQVTLMERKPKNAPTCPACHDPVTLCPKCKGDMRGTVEKGVDSAIVTDMINLAWENSYEVAVLVSADRDFIPAVQFLDAKGRKVVHAGFPPKGVDLQTNCWASLDLNKLKIPMRA